MRDHLFVHIVMKKSFPLFFVTKLFCAKISIELRSMHACMHACREGGGIINVRALIFGVGMKEGSKKLGKNLPQSNTDLIPRRL